LPNWFPAPKMREMLDGIDQCISYGETQQGDAKPAMEAWAARPTRYTHPEGLSAALAYKQATPLPSEFVIIKATFQGGKTSYFHRLMARFQLHRLAQGLPSAVIFRNGTHTSATRYVILKSAVDDFKGFAQYLSVENLAKVVPTGFNYDWMQTLHEGRYKACTVTGIRVFDPSKLSEEEKIEFTGAIEKLALALDRTAKARTDSKTKAPKRKRTERAAAVSGEGGREGVAAARAAAATDEVDGGEGGGIGEGVGERPRQRGRRRR
jgi:hypothetical protein